MPRDGFTFNLYELASKYNNTSGVRQSGFLLIFDFQGANSEKVELNKNCL